VKKRAENIVGGPADGGWHDPPKPTLGEDGSPVPHPLPTAWLVDAATPYYAHVYVFMPTPGRWEYQGMCIEAELFNTDEESGE